MIEKPCTGVPIQPLGPHPKALPRPFRPRRKELGSKPSRRVTLATSRAKSLSFLSPRKQREGNGAGNGASWRARGLAGLPGARPYRCGKLGAVAGVEAGDLPHTPVRSQLGPNLDLDFTPRRATDSGPRSRPALTRCSPVLRAHPTAPPSQTWPQPPPQSGLNPHQPGFTSGLTSLYNKPSPWPQARPRPASASTLTTAPGPDSPRFSPRP